MTSRERFRCIFDGELPDDRLPKLEWAPYWKKTRDRWITEELPSHGITTFINSDGDISEMVPWLNEAGIEGVFPLERQAGVDIAQIRADYPDFLMIGGYDKMIMHTGTETLSREFERLLEEYCTAEVRR